MTLQPPKSHAPEREEPPRLILEVTAHRCSHRCSEAYMPPEIAQRPLLVKVCLNSTMKSKCLLQTGQVPQDQYVCVNYRCGALMEALKALAPLQDVVK